MLILIFKLSLILIHFALELSINYCWTKRAKTISNDCKINEIKLRFYSRNYFPTVCGAATEHDCLLVLWCGLRERNQ